VDSEELPHILGPVPETVLSLACRDESFSVMKHAKKNCF
jgi:hypothetical protein